MVKSPPLIWGPDVKDLYKQGNEDGLHGQSLGRIMFKAAWGICQGQIAAVEKVMTSEGLDLQDIIKKGTVDIRYGTANQNPIPELNRQVKFTPMALDLLKYDKTADLTAGEDDNAVVVTTSQPIENFGLVLTNPSGLYFKETAELRKGNPGPKTCRLAVYYKRVSDPDVSNVQVTDEAVGTGNGTKKTYQLQHDAIVANTLTVKLNGNVTSSYTSNLGKGSITFSTNVGNGVVITATYQYPVNNWKRVNQDQGSDPEYKVVRTTTLQGDATSSVDGVASSVSGANPLWTWGGTFIMPCRREFEAATVYEVTEKTYKVTSRTNAKGNLVSETNLTKTTTFDDPRPLKLPKDYYNIRIENRTETIYDDDVDDIQIVGLQEITYEDDLSYPWTAIYFLRSNATQNLERSMLSLDFIVHAGFSVDLNDYFADGTTTAVYSDNCANVAADVLTNPLYGLGYTLADLDESTWLAFYDHCEESLEFGEWQDFLFNATGSLPTQYALPNFTSESEVDYVRIYTGSHYVPVSAEDYTTTAHGIVFTNKDTMPLGPRPNPDFGSSASAAKNLEAQQVKVRYRTNLKRGTVSATFDSKTSYEETLLALLEPLSAYVYTAGGKVCVGLDRDETPGSATLPEPVVTLDVQSSFAVMLDSKGTQLGDRMKTSIKVSANPRKIRANRIRVKYANGQNNFKDDVVVVEDALAIQTNGVQVLEKTAQTIAHRRQAEEYAKYLLRNLLIDDLAVQVSTFPIGQILVPGDIIAVTDTTRDWDEQRFRVTGVRLLTRTDAMGAELTLVPYNDDKYTAPVQNGVTRRLRPGVSSQNSTNTGTYLRTSSAQDASFQVVR